MIEYALVDETRLIDAEEGGSNLDIGSGSEGTASAFRTALCGWNGGVSAGIELFANATQRV
jgi:hypothetical protein